MEQIEDTLLSKEVHFNRKYQMQVLIDPVQEEETRHLYTSTRCDKINLTFHTIYPASVSGKDEIDGCKLIDNNLIALLSIGNSSVPNDTYLHFDICIGRQNVIIITCFIKHKMRLVSLFAFV